MAITVNVPTIKLDRFSPLVSKENSLTTNSKSLGLKVNPIVTTATVTALHNAITDPSMARSNKVFATFIRFVPPQNG